MASRSRSTDSTAIASSWPGGRSRLRRPFPGRGTAMLSTVLLFKDALYGALVIGLACSVIGVYVVLRRIVFVGAALAQISSAGIALALWLAGAGIAVGGAANPTVV